MSINISESSPTLPNGSQKSRWTRKGGHLYKSIIRATSEKSKRVKDKECYSSIYYKGLLAPVITGTKLANRMSAIAHKLENLDPSSPYYRGLLYKSYSTRCATTTTTAQNKLENLNPSSPYYRGLLYKSYSTRCATTTTTTAKQKNLKPSSPYYRGLLFKSCGTGCTITTTTAKHKLKKFNYQVHIPKDCIINRQLKLSNKCDTTK